MEDEAAGNALCFALLLVSVVPEEQTANCHILPELEQLGLVLLGQCDLNVVCSLSSVM